MFTVSFFGSQSIDFNTKNKLKKIILDIIKKQNTEFLITNDNDFNNCAFQILKDIENGSNYYNFFITFVSSEKNENYNNDFAVFYYDKNDIFEKDRKLKRAINIINRSDICIFCINDDIYVQKALDYADDINKSYIILLEWT